MSYTIDERNPERQQLLAEFLNPPTREVLARLPKIAKARVLDLGCGQGNTTRCLADALSPDECIGLEYDAGLVEYAASRPDNPSGVTFQQGDATRLPFADASFDVVFCRYLLIHMAEPARVVREMMRVVRRGGFAVAYEADCSTREFSHPPSAAVDALHRVWQVFQNPGAGRKVVQYFRDAGASSLQAGAVLLLEHGTNKIKRCYRLTAEATGPTAIAKGLLTAHEVADVVEGLTRLEHDAASILVKFPDMWVIAEKT
jgi:ubiquinone/menaquinone biosynthesis C-methylase UbiE